MLGEDGIAENIYTFSGTNVSQKDFNERGRNSRELLFAKYVASGLGALESYKKAYPDARSSSYIKDRTDKLLKTETINTMITEERRKIRLLKGEIPSPINPPSGCVFRTRCPNPTHECKHGTSKMGLIEPKPGHFVDQCCYNCN